LLICVICGSIFAGSLLVANDTPQPSDVIIVIGGDHKPERVKRAVELYQQGYAPIVIISAGTKVWEGDEWMHEAEVMRRQALMRGLPEADLWLESESLSTFQNAYYTKAICQSKGFKSVLLVASAYHSRRAKRIFQDVFGENISVSVQAAPQTLCTLCWWFQPDQVSVILYEYYNWGRYWLGIRLSNETPPNNTQLNNPYNRSGILQKG